MSGSFGDTVVLDTLRVLMASAALAVGGYQVKLYLEAVTAGQKARLAGIAGSLVLVGALRMQHLGDSALTWDAYLSAAIIALFAYGSWKWRQENPSTDRPPSERR